MEIRDNDFILPKLYLFVRIRTCGQVGQGDLMVSVLVFHQLLIVGPSL